MIGFALLLNLLTGPLLVGKIFAPFLLTIEEVLACQERLKAENQMSNFLKPLSKSVTFENLDEKGKFEVGRFYESKETTIIDKRHLMARESSIQVMGKISLKIINRYSRGLETCPQAKTFKSGQAIFFFFSDASERRV